MHATTAEHIRQVVDDVYRSESRRVFATLIRLLGDIDLAEEALHEAFAAAVEQWTRDGMPSHPRAWLVSVGRFKAIDAMRRRIRLDASLAAHATTLEPTTAPLGETDDVEIEDDRLRLIFTCCHPVLSPDAQVAMTLRAVCGLTTEEIAHAFEDHRGPPAFPRRDAGWGRESRAEGEQRLDAPDGGCSDGV